MDLREKRRIERDASRVIAMEKTKKSERWFNQN